MNSARRLLGRVVTSVKGAGSEDAEERTESTGERKPNQSWSLPPRNEGESIVVKPQEPYVKIMGRSVSTATKPHFLP